MIHLTIHEKEHLRALVLDSLPIIFGRDHSADVFIRDPSVSRKHAEITAGDFGYILRDLNSRNGIYKDGVRISSLALTGKCTIFLGDTKIEIEINDHKNDTKTVRRQAFNDYIPSSPFGSVLRIFSSIVFIILTVLLSAYLVSWPPDSISRLWGRLFVYCIIAITAAGCLTIAGKITTKHIYFDKFLFAITSLGVMTYSIWQWLPILLFNFHSPGITPVICLFLTFLITTWFVARILRYTAPRWRGKFRRLTAMGLGLVSLTVPLAVKQEGDVQGEREQMSNIGLDILPISIITNTTEDLMFDVAISIAESDQARIKLLESLTEEESDQESP